MSGLLRGYHLVPAHESKGRWSLPAPPHGLPRLHLATPAALAMAQHPQSSVSRPCKQAISRSNAQWLPTGPAVQQYYHREAISCCSRLLTSAPQARSFGIEGGVAWGGELRATPAMSGRIVGDLPSPGRWVID